MNKPFRQSQYGRLLALVAILALALLPTLSRALAHLNAGPGWASVCTSPVTPAAPSDTAPGLADCAMCLLAQSGSAPLPLGRMGAWAPTVRPHPPQWRAAAAAWRPVAAVWQPAWPRPPPAHAEV